MTGLARHSAIGRFTSGAPLVIAAAAFLVMAGAVAQETRVAPHPTASAPALHDWVLNPVVLPEEKDARPLRIVSAAPMVTEICCALGLRNQLVGRTRYCDYPPGIESLPAIGALNDLNSELLLTLKPDLVLVSGNSRQITERIEQLGFKYESVPDRSLADLFSAIRKIGELTGRRATAAALCAGISADLAAIDAPLRTATSCATSSPSRAASNPSSRRVLLLTGSLANPPGPPFVAGPGSFYDELLQRAGLINIAGKMTQDFGPLPLEVILQADPDLIIELDPDGRARPQGDSDALEAWTRLGPLKAVRERRIHVLKGPHHYLLGPRIAETYAAIVAASRP